MAELYRVMVHNPADIGFEDDSFAEGWTWTRVDVERDGDVITLTVQAGTTDGYIEKAGLNIDASTYPYLAVCLKGDGDYRVAVYDGAWKDVQGWASSPTDYEVKIYDLSSVTTGTITAVRLYSGQAEGKKTHYDFVAFSKAQPIFVQNLVEVRVHQRESDLDTFELLKDGCTGLTLGHHVRIWLNSVKVFAGIIEEATPEEGGVLHASGRCFGQKLLLRTKSISWSGREVSQAVKDLVSDMPEITTYSVETPNPTVTVTKDLKYEYIADALKDLARHVGSDWEWKLGMGHDLRFRSRNSPNVPTAPTTLQEGVNVLRGVRRESDTVQLYNKVVVIGGARSNPSGDPDEWTDQGDAQDWTTDPSANISEDQSERAAGTCSIHLSQPETAGVSAMYLKYDFGASGIDVAPFTQLRFHHKTDQNGIITEYGEDWTAETVLEDTSNRTVSKTYLDDVQPPQTLTEVALNLQEFTGDANFDWTAVRYITLKLKTDDGASKIWGQYWIDKLHFYTPNIKAEAVDTTSPINHVREYILRDEHLTDPDFIKEAADALLTTLKNTRNHYRVSVSGAPELQAGVKVNVEIPSHGLSGTYYIAEAEHRLTSNGLVSEITLEKPALTLEEILAESIMRRISLIERGGVE